MQAKWRLVRKVTPGHGCKQTVLGQPSQATAPMQIFFLRLLDCRIHATTVHILSFCLPHVAAFCTVVCRAEVELYFLYMH